MRQIFRLLAALGALLALGVTAQAAQSVTVKGSAEIVGSNLDGARSKALASAFREAVEKGIGVWVQSQTEVKDAELVRDQILTSAQGYVTDHEILKEKVEGQMLVLTVRANVAVDRIGADLKTLVARLSTSLGHPSIAFVLTTWEKRGAKDSARATDYVERSGGADGKDDDHGVLSKGVKRIASFSTISEDLWKKYPDSTIIDAFQQEFLAKNFDLMAADKAREIAFSESLAQTSVNPNDRKAVRDCAANEGANFVARGEIRLLGYGVSEATGNQEVKTQIGVEIIDVNSGDIVGSFSNSATGSSSSADEARMQSIKKNAVLAARTLAAQTIDVWQKRSLNGRQFGIEVRNIKSIRSQQLPILAALKGVAQISSQSNPDKTTLLVRVMYKGDKEALGSAILEGLGTKPGFSESDFDGPFNEDGKIIFKFK